VIDRAEYEVCRRRGHEGGLLDTNGKWSRCKWCGIWLRSVRVIEERQDEPPGDERSPVDRYL